MEKIDLVIISDTNIDHYIENYITQNNLKFNKIFIVSKEHLETKYKNITYKDFILEEYLPFVNKFNIINETDNIRYLSIHYYVVFEQDIISNKELINFNSDKIKKDDLYHYSAKLFLKHFFNKTQVNKIEGFKLINKNKVKELKEQFPEIFHNSSKNNKNSIQHNLNILYNYIF